jgi:hypothetical protein
MSPVNTKVKIPRELRRVHRVAVAQGWTVTLTGGGHHCWCSATGAQIFTGSTPGDQRSIKNHIAKLRRAGLRL